MPTTTKTMTFNEVAAKCRNDWESIAKNATENIACLHAMLSGGEEFAVNAEQGMVTEIARWQIILRIAEMHLGKD